MAAPPRPESLPLRWLYLDLNSFFASVEQQLNPDLRGRPVAVGPGHIDSGTIIAASYEAKRHGVRTGMRVGEAKRRCPELVFAGGGGHDRYVRVHHQVIAEVERHAPVAKICSIDEVAVRLCDNENAPAQAAALAARIKASLRANVGACVTASIGVAPSRLLAKIAADMMKPDGLTILAAADLPHRLHALQLNDIPGIGPAMEARLRAAGIDSVAALLARAPRSAGGAWGSVVGERLWWALHGHDLPDPPRRSHSVGHSHVLAPQRRDPATARETARRLLMKAAQRLRAEGGETRHVTLHARFETGGGWSATRRVPATADSFALLDALATLWPALAEELAGRRIRTVGVSLDDIAPAAPQPSLFAALPPDEPLARATRTPALSAALDKVAARFGRDAVTLGVAERGSERLRDAGGRIAFHRIPTLEEAGG